MFRKLTLLLAITILPYTIGRAVDYKSKQSAWEQSGLFEGDIKLTENQVRNGLIDPSTRWPDNTVPYVIDSNSFSPEQVAQILSGMEEYHSKTCIRFREYDPQTDTDYLSIQGENSGCWSYVGRIGGKQEVNYAPDVPGSGCFRIGTIEHELLHSLGFYHQQSATERDDYVRIAWENISSGTEHNFDKYDASTITSFGVQYDYDSVMHYGEYAFSANGERTIIPLDENAQIGQRNGFSARDLEKLAKMYGC